MEGAPTSLETATYEVSIGQYEKAEDNKISIESQYGNFEALSDIGGPRSRYKEN